jgi:hypothetical protein
LTVFAGKGILQQLSKANEVQQKRHYMTKTWHLCMVLSVFALSISAWSAESMTIEQVHTQYNASTTALDAAAIGVIDDFWQKNMDVIMLSEDADKIVELRLELKKYKGADALSYYSSAYQKAAKEHLKVVTDTTDKWENGIRKARVERNLMILVTELGSVTLIDLAIPKLSNIDPMVRYWAVRALTSRDIIDQSKADAVTRDDKRTAQIIAALEEYLKSTPDIATISLVTHFASEINTEASRKMLCGMADRRIDAYMKWTVTNEQLDADILKSIGNLGVQISDPAQKQELLSRFGQLYACVLGRYIQGAKIPGVSKEKLISVIVEVEDKVLLKPVSWASKFRTDLSMNKPLAEDYDLLFGSNGQAGELVTKLNFNYGKDGSGKALIVPKPLPSPPASAVGAQVPVTPAAAPEDKSKAPVTPAAAPEVKPKAPVTPAAPATKP